MFHDRVVVEYVELLANVSQFASQNIFRAKFISVKWHLVQTNHDVIID